MKSIKQGRGPSLVGGMAMAGMALFGVFWCLFAAQIGAPGVFIAFGVVFIAIALVGAVYNLVNATRKNRFSEFDIVDDGEEPDPLNQFFGASAQRTEGAAFCPQCGHKLNAGDRFCGGCGRRIGNDDRKEGE